MLETRDHRQLLAIMFTDVVGYTALTERDEAAAVRLGEAMIGNLCKIQAGLGKINLSRIPDDYPLNSASEEFNQEEMKNLFEAGKKWATASPIRWESTVDAGESPLPCSDN